MPFVPSSFLLLVPLSSALHLQLHRPCAAQAMKPDETQSAKSCHAVRAAASSNGKFMGGLCCTAMLLLRRCAGSGSGWPKAHHFVRARMARMMLSHSMMAGAREV